MTDAEILHALAVLNGSQAIQWRQMAGSWAQYAADWEAEGGATPARLDTCRRGEAFARQVMVERAKAAWRCADNLLVAVAVDGDIDVASRLLLSLCETEVADAVTN